MFGRWWYTPRTRNNFAAIHKSVRLSNGQKLYMRFDFDPDDRSVDVAMACYRNWFRREKAFDKEGTAIGPGGLEVLPVALKLFEEGEVQAIRRWKPLEIWVGAATLKLHRIYARYLQPRGYDIIGGDYTPYLVKECFGAL